MTKRELAEQVLRAQDGLMQLIDVVRDLVKVVREQEHRITALEEKVN